MTPIRFEVEERFIVHVWPKQNCRITVRTLENLKRRPEVEMRPVVLPIYAPQQWLCRQRSMRTVWTWCMSTFLKETTVIFAQHHRNESHSSLRWTEFWRPNVKLACHMPRAAADTNRKKVYSKKSIIFEVEGWWDRDSVIKKIKAWSRKAISNLMTPQRLIVL